MPGTPNIIKDFPKCPDCGSEETVSQLGCAGIKEVGKIPPDTFTSLKKEVIPLEQPQLAGVGVQCILSHFDICAGCGRERCTRSEIIMAPVQGAPSIPPGNFGPNRAERRRMN